MAFTSSAVFVAGEAVTFCRVSEESALGCGKWEHGTFVKRVSPNELVVSPAGASLIRVVATAVVAMAPAARWRLSSPCCVSPRRHNELVFISSCLEMVAVAECCFNS